MSHDRDMTARHAILSAMIAAADDLPTISTIVTTQARADALAAISKALSCTDEAAVQIWSAPLRVFAPENRARMVAEIEGDSLA